MVRILHLHDTDADFETLRSIEGLSRALDEGFSVTQRVIGAGESSYRNAPIAAATLRREQHNFDLIHACGGKSLAVASLSTNRPIVFSPAIPTRLQTIRWLRAVTSHRNVQIISPTATLRRKMIERGLPADRTHLIRPGVEFARIRGRRDNQLRASLGFTESDHVLFAAGESTRGATHQDATWASSILHLTDSKFKLLLWGRGSMLNSAVTLARNLQHEQVVTVAERRLGCPLEFEQLLPAADTIVVTARGQVATLPIMMAMAAALPIVSTVTYTVGELLEDRHTALMTQAGKPRLFARRILDLMEEPNLQWSISDMARTEAYEYFSFTRFINQFRTVYRQIAEGQKVEVPETAPGAGSRFHGRV